MRLDLDYTRSLVGELEDEAAHYTAVARRYGVTSVHATAQVAAALQAMGETLTETTATGQLAVGKEVLLPMADLDTQWRRVGAREPNPLADAVLRAKRAQKWAASYGHAMLQLVDPGGRIHPDINTLGARPAGGPYPTRRCSSCRRRTGECVAVLWPSPDTSSPRATWLR